MALATNQIQSLTAGLVRPFAKVRGAHRLCHVMNRAFLALGSSPVRITRTVDGALMMVDLRSGTEWFIYYSGRYDEREIKLIKILLAERGDFLDVGGNIGIYAVRIGRLLAKTGSRVHCFEPVPANRRRIVQNLELNGLKDAVSVYDIALSSTEGAVDIVLREDFILGAETGNASVAISEEADGAFTRIQARSAPFDAIRQEFEIGPVSVLKVDIEGHEDQFLQGAKTMIKTDRPIMFTEINSWYFERRGLTVEAAFDGVLPSDYKKFEFVDKNSLDVRLFEYFSQLQGFANIVLAPEKRVDELLSAVRAGL
jgi:FkbM family methyltransferase